MTHPFPFRRGLRPLAVVILCATAGAAQAPAQSLTITTLAGRVSSSGSTDGSGDAARFGTGLNSMVVDAAGQVVLLDANNYTVRRISPTGTVTTLAGASGVSDYRDGTGTDARFRQPRSLARDAAGNLYLADFNNNGSQSVRRITPAGVVSTLPLTANIADALAIDAAGRIIIAGGQRLRAFVDGLVELPPTWAPGAVATGNVWALTAAPDGAFLLLDYAGHEVRRLSATGVMTSLAGRAGTAGYADGTGTAARFHFPSSGALDTAGQFYVADSANRTIRRISPDGAVVTVAGTASPGSALGPYSDGVGGDARFKFPSALALGADGTLFIFDSGAIRRGMLLPAAARVAVPPANQVATAGERVTFAVTANGNPAPTYQWQRSRAGGTLWENLVTGTLFAGTTSAALTIEGVTPAMNGDRYRCLVSNPTGTDSSAPASLAVDPPVVVAPLRVSTFAGRAGSQGGVDGTGAAASFSAPRGIATDAAGNVYVSDSVGNRIRKITPDGKVTTLAGSGTAGAADGTGTAAQFRSPGPLAVDAHGNVFVADQLLVPDYALLPTIRRITPAGVVTTFVRGSPAGPRFDLIEGLAFDRAGNLVVSSIADLLVRYSPDGVRITGGPFPVFAPWSGGIAFDTAGNLYGVNAYARVVFKFTTEGRLTLLNSGTTPAGALDGRAAAARFQSPVSIAVDRAGNVYVLDLGNQSIRRISPAGIVSTVAAIKPTAAEVRPVGASDGIGAAVRFRDPFALAIDRADNLYIADTGNHTIRRALPVDAVAAGEPIELHVQTTGAESAATAAGPSRAALGTGPTYQWFKNDTPIAGATAARWSLPRAAVADQGRYAVEVMTADGPSRSEAIALSVSGSRLVNLSIRSGAGPGNATLIVGFVVSGPALPLLVRGVGPGLIPLGVSAALPHPRLTLFADSSELTTNAGWADSPDLSEAATRLGAFPLAPGSLDAAVLPTIAAGAYTSQCTGVAGGSGTALVELYDASTVDAARSRLTNVSARSSVGAGDDLMIAGFSIRGSVPSRVLIRGVGPTLGLFGVEGALPNPQLRLFTGTGALRAENDDWSRGNAAAEFAATAQSVGAFALPPGSLDAGLLLSLDPGTYSVQLADAASRSGIALIEVYEVR